MGQPTEKSFCGINFKLEPSQDSRGNKFMAWHGLISNGKKEVLIEVDSSIALVNPNVFSESIKESRAILNSL